jgi:hypothetical protein
LIFKKEEEILATLVPIASETIPRDLLAMNGGGRRNFSKLNFFSLRSFRSFRSTCIEKKKKEREGERQRAIALAKRTDKGSTVKEFIINVSLSLFP